jgi:hypothetical protein
MTEEQEEPRYKSRETYGGRPTINVLAVEKEDRSLTYYLVWFYNNPKLGGLNSSTLASDSEKLIDYIKTARYEHEEIEVKSEFLMSDLEKIATGYKNDRPKLVQHQDGRISIKKKYYREDIFE